MKIIKTIILSLIIASSFILSACDSDSTAGISKVTYYVDLSIKGSPTMIVPLNGTYAEPGCKASAQGQDVTNRVVITSNIDTQNEGDYTVTYKIFNDDGFPAVQKRRVVVVDANYPLCGLYTSSISRDRAGAISQRGPYNIRIWKSEGSEKYNIDDMLGGWYAIGSNYGPAYAAQGVLNWDGTNLSHVGSSVAGWGDSVSNITFDSFDGTELKFTAEYGGMKFSVTAKKY